MALGGPRKPLKRLDPDKEIKVNSKENPNNSKDFPRVFDRNQRISKEAAARRPVPPTTLPW
jgi:hypothetical protein